jgi:hypothetical protein
MQLGHDTRAPVAELQVHGRQAGESRVDAEAGGQAQPRVWRQAQRRTCM